MRQIKRPMSKITYTTAHRLVFTSNTQKCHGYSFNLFHLRDIEIVFNGHVSCFSGFSNKLGNFKHCMKLRDMPKFLIHTEVEYFLILSLSTLTSPINRPTIAY
jgi:hypothetical protein